MTNKPMFSVERELLERILDSIGFGEREELRAILEDQYRPPPVNLYCNVRNVHITCNKDGSYTINPMPAAQAQTAEYEVRKLCADQPAPTADHTQCEECKGLGYHENHHEGGGTERGECGGSGNATVAVAVAMPDRMKVEPFTTIDRGSKNYKAGYNAAISEVGKLNGLKP